jgi:hypothetical protein
VTKEILLEPHFEGERFRNQSLPLVLLRDLEALQGIILEIAKDDYRQAHPNRQRLPRGFSEHLELHLSTRPGSFVAEVALIKDDALLAGCDPHLDQARRACARFVDVLAHVQEQRQGPPPLLPDAAWSYLEKFGRGLQPEESIRLTGVEAVEVRLTRELRRRLLLSRPGSEPLTEEVRVLAKLVDVRPREHVMTLYLGDGRMISAVISDQQVNDLGRVTVSEFGRRWVLVKGIASLDVNQQLLRIEDAETVEPLDALDPLVQLEQLRQLPAGWMDGEGLPPGSELLSLVGQWLEEHQHDDGEPPRLYPTAEGGVEAEWRIGRLDLSIEFDASSDMAEWHALDLDSGVVDEQQVSLRDGSGLKALGVKLQRVLADGGTKPSAAAEGGPT